MSDPTSIFGNENPPVPQDQTTNNGNVQTNQSNDDLVTLLNDIKNERGEPKYRTVRDAMNALKHSQEYIPELSQRVKQQEAELEIARNAATKVAELERIVQQLTQEGTPNTNQPVPQGVTQEQVAELVSQTLAKNQQEEFAKQNLSSVVSVAKQAFGDKAEAAFYTKANELGMTVQEINTLAAKNPKAVIRLLGIEDKAPSQEAFKPNTSSFNTSGFEQKTETFLGRNTKTTAIGATSSDLREESNNAKRMVEELHAKGMSIDDLIKPSAYFKVFGS